MTQRTTLIEPDELHEILGQPELVILDCRFSLQNTESGRDQYKTAHIPGAVYAHLEETLSSAVIPGVSGRHPLPVVIEIEQFLREAGVNQQSQIVAYDSSGSAFASRAWWVLKWLGHESVAVLNGGWQSWERVGFTIENESMVPERGDFRAEVVHDMLIDLADIDSVAADSDTLLVDARAAARFRGEEEPIDPVAGHIPGAISAPFKDNLDESSRFKSQSALRQRWSELIPDLHERNTSQIICYCGSGVTGAHDVLAMEYAGLGRPKLYVGSWSHWITDPSRKIERP